MLEGRLKLAQLKRVLPLVRSDAGDVDYTLNFDIDEGGIPCIKGEVRATLTLQCQRCMEDMDYPVKTKVRLGIVASREAAERLPDKYEPLLVSADEISVASIVEDELILALPIVAMHELKDCPQGEAFVAQTASGAGEEDTSAARRESPFAVLAQLKEDGTKTRTKTDEE
jgi:uncharacterized protein